MQNSVERDEQRNLRSCDSQKSTRLRITEEKGHIVHLWQQVRQHCWTNSIAGWNQTASYVTFGFSTDPSRGHGIWSGSWDVFVLLFRKMCVQSIATHCWRRYVYRIFFSFRQCVVWCSVSGAQVEGFRFYTYRDGDYDNGRESGDMLMYSMQRVGPDSTDESDALPFIYYDPTRDGLGVEPDQFISIPASRSLFLASDGK